MKLQQFVALAAQLSRRKAALNIKEGQVTVNGQVVLEPYRQIETETDAVLLKGKRVLLKRDPEIVLLLHKPAGFITADHDPEGRPLARELFRSKVKTRVFPVGRLDFNSEGLLLFTNNGDLANQVAHPRYQIPRTYKLKVHGVVQKKHLDRIRKGLFVPELGHFPSCKIYIKRATGKNTWLTITLQRGKNRELRRLFQFLGYPVVKLIRTHFGPFSLTGIPRGKIHILSESELVAFRQYLAKRNKEKSKIEEKVGTS
ncbi:pseudouridine synthase [candidate division CSSED10-310 bacterium]|uniref:Pseudouridine synthase n=1 Tax=candidate division CSSED10-310 bacterium TaxID=2855610 RepID=A0ABV6YS12_UNCC1